MFKRGSKIFLWGGAPFPWERALTYIITVRKRSLGQGNVGNVFTPVCYSVQGEGSLSRGVSVQRGLCPGDLCQGDPSCMVKSERYASYWNAFFVSVFSEKSHIFVNATEE